MKLHLMVAATLSLLAAGPVIAQTSGTTSTAPAPSAAAPIPGANSFTKGEARKRIEAQGFANVSDLKKDDQGIWRCEAMKNGKKSQVALDYKGNVIEK
jgi:putative membrane protein